MSPDVKPVTISSSAPVNLVLIDPTNSNVLPLRAVNGIYLVIFPFFFLCQVFVFVNVEEFPVLLFRYTTGSSYTDSISNKTK